MAKPKVRRIEAGIVIEVQKQKTEVDKIRLETVEVPCEKQQILYGCKISQRKAKQVLSCETVTDYGHIDSFSEDEAIIN